MGTIELYRRSTIGLCLIDSLDQLVTRGVISSELGNQVLNQFDESMAEALKTMATNKVKFKGNLHTYNYCDNVWWFILQNVELEIGKDQQLTVEALKIVACDSKLVCQECASTSIGGNRGKIKIEPE